MIAPKQAHAAEQHRNRNARQMRDRRAAASEIGKIPAPKDPPRRASCERDLHLFLVTYFPNGTGQKPFGPKQVDAIKRLEYCILNSGRFVNLLPRGYCKSSISEGACIWATLYGHRRFVLFLGANEDSASAGIESIKRELAENPLLAEDFPEVCKPIEALQGKHQRCNSQTHDGLLTHIEWTGTRIVLPCIAGSVASEAVISADGLLSASRGARYMRSDGTRARPDFCVIDDPQTDQSAISPTETAKRIRVIRNSILRLGGHGKQVSVVVNATMIAEGDLVDQMCDRKRFPGWNTVRAPTVLSMPVALESHWLKTYADTLKNFDEDDLDGQRNALDAATAFYQANRSVMDEGASVAWDEVPLEPGEVSALQHALNILILEGQEVFDAEVQNQPAKKNVASHLHISKLVGSRVNGYAQRELPEGAGYYVFHVDVHDELLYWSRAAVQQNFTGAIVDYGTWPQQPTSYFSHNAIKRTLSDQYTGTNVDNAIRLGLSELIRFLAVWHLPLSVGLVDAGYKPEVALDAIRLAGVANVYTAVGVGIGPDKKPMPEYDVSSKRCYRAGPDPTRPRWYFPREHVLRVHSDTNYWKDFAASRLTQQAAEGAWRLFGNEHTNHSMYADHLISEQPVAMSAHGRTCNVWRVVSHRDNHYWDTFVGCVVAASIAGCRLPGSPLPRRAPKPRRTGRRITDMNI